MSHWSSQCEQKVVFPLTILTASYRLKLFLAFHRGKNSLSFFRTPIFFLLPSSSLCPRFVQINWKEWNDHLCKCSLEQYCKIDQWVTPMPMSVMPLEKLRIVCTADVLLQSLFSLSEWKITWLSSQFETNFRTCSTIISARNWWIL